MWLFSLIVRLTLTRMLTSWHKLLCNLLKRLVLSVLSLQVGMLSYSTLGSGSGPDVDLVSEATDKLSQLDPDLAVVGPIQFDAAWSPQVARIKAKGSDVAGHVNVFVFPSLSAGNIGYKAVQRSSGAFGYWSCFTRSQ